MRRAIFIAHLAVVHGLLAFVLWKSDFLVRVKEKLGTTPRVLEITDYYKSTLRYQINMDGNVPDNAVVFIGDSLTQSLYVDAVTRPSVNYGIGGDTTVGVLGRLPEYRSLLRASAVVMAIGVVDIKFRDNQEIIHNYRRILQALPPAVPVVCSAILPVNETIMLPTGISNARIRDLNVSLKALCSEDTRYVFVDIGSSLIDAGGNLSVAFQDGDGVHLNSSGNRVWIDELRTAIGKVSGVASVILEEKSMQSRMRIRSATPVERVIHDENRSNQVSR